VARARYLSGYVQSVASGAQIMIGASPVLLESAPLDRIGSPR
jgi:hypothetical protein